MTPRIRGTVPAAHEHVVRDYYRALDRHLAAFLEVLPDAAAVVVASDHGARPMMGGFCLNEWLVREGLLRLAATAGPTPIARAQVDWPGTTAWGDGGFYGRVFLNVEGASPRARSRRATTSGSASSWPASWRRSPTTRASRWATASCTRRRCTRRCAAWPRT